MQFIYKEWSEHQGIAYAWWQCMHTRIDIILCGYPETKLRLLVEEIKQELTRIEKIGNYYDVSAELHRVNQRAALNPVEISNELYEMIKEGIDYHRRTCGYFDITVRSEKYKESVIASVELFPENHTVSFKWKGIRLDLSGYLKGYGLDRIREIILENQITDALVNMGNSSVLAVGNHPHGEGWKIQYNEDFGNETDSILLHNECLTTSGNETTGRRHIVNPLTGFPVEGKGKVSVITSAGTDGEVLSTALFAAGEENRDKILANFPEAKIVTNS